MYAVQFPANCKLIYQTNFLSFAGAYERQLKLPLTPTFDCSRTKVAKIQAGINLNYLYYIFNYLCYRITEKCFLTCFCHNFIVLVISLLKFYICWCILKLSLKYLLQKKTEVILSTSTKIFNTLASL